MRDDDTAVPHTIRLELFARLSEAVVAYTLLQLHRAVEERTFTVQLAAELAKRVRAEGWGR